MNSLLGFGGLLNTGLTAASYKSPNRKNAPMNKNNNNYVPFENTRKRVGNLTKKASNRVGNLTKKASSALSGLFGKKGNIVSAAAPLVAAAPSFALNQYKSKVPVFKTRTRKNKPMSNVYVPSNTQAPNVNLSYVENRNESVRNALDEMIVASNVSHNKPLTNKQRAARINVARKMARGEPVSYLEKVNAGMVTFQKPSMPKPSMPKPMMPKPTGPKPASGGKRSRKAHRRRRTVRRR